VAVVRWQFYDTVTGDSYTFEFNPSEGGSPAYERNLNVQRTTAGALIVLEGTQNPQTLNFSGTILTQEHYEALTTWMENRHVLQLTDDLNRSWYVVLQSFQPQRVRSATRPWKHTYNMVAQVVT